MSFAIKSITAMTHDHSFGGYPWKVEVEVAMQVKEWRKYRDQDDLGHLYGVAISNAVFAINRNVPAHAPTVDDRARSECGVKTILLTYYLSTQDADRAEALGLTVRRFKTGEVYGGFHQCVKIA